MQVVMLRFRVMELVEEGSVKIQMIGPVRQEDNGYKDQQKTKTRIK